MFPVVIAYLGLVAGVAGVVSLVKPLRFLGICTRKAAASVIGSALVLEIASAFYPVQETRVVQSRSDLDRFAPVYQFNEVHSASVAAGRDQAYDAIKSVTADEIKLFRSLTWIRRLGKTGKESILNPPPHEPLLKVAARTSFILLSEKPGQEIVLGTLVAAPRGWRPSATPTAENFLALDAPGFAKATINFRVESNDARSSRITTETRVYATDPATRRSFAAYWHFIYPGSALIRHMWLRAIVARAGTGK